LISPAAFMTMSGDILLAAPISSFGPHFDLVQSCALAVPTVANKATEQLNTNALSIAVPPVVFDIMVLGRQQFILTQEGDAIHFFERNCYRHASAIPGARISYYKIAAKNFRTTGRAAICCTAPGPGNDARADSPFT
jgi:hypothetical protein